MTSIEILSAQEKDIDYLVRARFPFIYLVSWEENRVKDFLVRLAASQNKRLYVWSATDGMMENTGVGPGDKSSPFKLLDQISMLQVHAIFVLKDFHPHFSDARLVRQFRDLIPKLKASHKTVVFLSPVLTIPVELEKDVTVVDYELPGVREMASLTDELLASAKSSGKLAKPLEAEDREKIARACLGMTLSEAESALALALVANPALTAEVVEETLLKETKQIIRKSKVLEYFEADEAFGEIGGLDLLKNWVNKRGQAFSDKARQFGLPDPKGILIMGVQGCGKSLTCKAISGLWKLPLLRLDMGSIFGQFVGQSEENMRRAIKTAESVAPCILWVDEIEKGLAGSQSSGSVDAGTTSRIFSYFLTWLQEKKKPVFVAATANNIDQLPPELLRKGRLDEIFFIDLPSEKERADIFTIHLRRKKRVVENFDVARLAKISEGFSGAEIEQAVVEALYNAFAQNRDITSADVEGAVTDTVPLSTTMNEKIQAIRDWARTRARPASGHVAV